MASSNWLILCCALIAIVCVCNANGGLLGGQQSESVYDDGVKEAAKFAETELNKMSNNMYYMKNTEILKAKKQIVRGVVYYLTLELTSTECRNNPKTDEEIEECKVSEKEDASRVEECEVEVYYDIPQNNVPPKLEDFHCEPVQQKPVLQKYKDQEKLKLH